MADLIATLNAALKGRYLVEEKLGQGGMATVFRAADLRHDRTVALKVLRPELAAAVGPDRFTAEIRTTAGLQHPHVLPLFDSGAADGHLFYAMPLVRGETLRERLDRTGPLPQDKALSITADVADCSRAAAQRGREAHREWFLSGYAGIYEPRAGRW
jgi:serine/threonine-protein kinase